jgi:hypothetical protein
MRKRNDVESPTEAVKDMLEHHLNVGREKPVSYLPIRTIEDVIKISVEAYVALFDDTGNRCVVFRGENCCINSGAVYAYSPEELGRVLDESGRLLAEHGWPVVPADFIKRIASDWLGSQDPIMSVIKQSFGEL